MAIPPDEKLWKSLASRLPAPVLETLIYHKMWTKSDGPTKRFDQLTEQLRRYFGFYPDSESLRAEFQFEFENLNQEEQDALFRLVKNVDRGRE